MIVAITNLKGGVGKTTTAMFLAEAARRAGESSSVIDADSQGSATLWANAAEDDGAPLPFDVVLGNKTSLRRLRSGDDWVFIDCPPSGDVCRAAKEISDFIVIPTSPSNVDMQQVYETINDLPEGAAYAVLILKANKRTNAFKSVVESLERDDTSYFETVIPQREDVKNTFANQFGSQLYGYEEVFSEIKGAL
ncbi:MAG: ParA family protein [Eggerthellaceae bacterium]|nr:ParA family protein [Eggerthellaceae bacterium]